MKLRYMLLLCLLPLSAVAHEGARAGQRAGGAPPAATAPGQPAPAGQAAYRPPTVGAPAVRILLQLPAPAPEPASDINDRPPRQSAPQTRQRRFLSTSTPLPLSTSR